jgi:hypothetical protein
MRTRSKLVLTALAATLLMGFAVSAASANRIATSSRNFRVVWTGLVFTDEEGVGRVTCPVTLEGSFHSSTISKVPNALIGFVSRASVTSSSCNGGGATILGASSLPWHITYDSFTGTLPTITAINVLLSRTAFLVNVFGINCLYQENGVSRARGRINVGAGGVVSTLDPDPTIRLPKFSGSFLCPERGGFTGTGTVTNLANTTRITVTLI